MGFSLPSVLDIDGIRSAAHAERQRARAHRVAGRRSDVAERRHGSGAASGLARGTRPGPVSRVPVALTIAGSDPSGGAGLQADLAAFAAFGVHGASVVTALTVQDTCGVRRVVEVAADVVGQQLDALLDDLE